MCVCVCVCVCVCMCAYLYSLRGLRVRKIGCGAIARGNREQWSRAGQDWTSEEKLGKKKKRFNEVAVTDGE